MYVFVINAICGVDIGISCYCNHFAGVVRFPAHHHVRHQLLSQAYQDHLLLNG